MEAGVFAVRPEHVEGCAPVIHQTEKDDLRPWSGIFPRKDTRSGCPSRGTWQLTGLLHTCHLDADRSREKGHVVPEQCCFNGNGILPPTSVGVRMTVAAGFLRKLVHAVSTGPEQFAGVKNGPWTILP